MYQDYYSTGWIGNACIKWSDQDQVRALVRKTAKILQETKDLGWGRSGEDKGPCHT